MRLLSVSHSYFFFIFIFCYIYTSSHWLSCWWQPGHFDQCWCSSMLVLGPGSWQLGGDWAGIRTCHGLIWPWLWPGHFDQHQCSSTLVLGPKTTISKPSRAWLDSGTACSCILDTSQLLQHMEKGTHFDLGDDLVALTNISVPQRCSWVLGSGGLEEQKLKKIVQPGSI